MDVFRGIWPALVTPSSADHTVNVDVLRDLVDYLLAKGVDGFYIGGTTGEGIFMPVAQRKLLAETVLAHINGRVPVILHAGAVAADDAIDLARHGQEHGAVGISSIIPPLYTSLAAIVPYYTELAAAADLPFIAYILNPQFDSVALMQRLMAIPNLAGSKYTGPNMYEFRRIIDLGGGQWTMFSGMDEQCVYAAMMGATGAIGSTLNLMPGAFRQIRAHVEAGRCAEAQALQVRVNRVIEVMIGVGFQGALKELLSHLLDKPFGSPRLPQLPLNTSQRDTLYRQLAETDFEALAAL
jgi:N-acetylneuraminate lyase